MFCKNCGKEIDDNAIICIHCGVSTNLNRSGAAMYE
ncbi:MAG: zinc ribbon domain-containing protein, partial [Candidatus Cloacimonetes bacterium]|nr:zinc ribbon domain-containing protein [Candidatus Cloacimonadota bacterium]